MSLVNHARLSTKPVDNFVDELTWLGPGVAQNWAVFALIKF